MSKILILGSGFGATYAAKELLSKLGNNHEITMVSNRNEFIFIPLIHEVSVGFLHHDDISQKITDIFPQQNFRFIKSDVKSIDFAAKTVDTGSGEQQYDYLLVALGSVPNKALISKVLDEKQKIYYLKSESDADEIRAKLNEIASKYLSSESKAKQINIVFIGGGATGIELAGEVSLFFSQYFADFGEPEAFEDVNINIIDRAPKIIPQADDQFREAVMQRLRQLKIDVHSDAVIEKLSGNKIEFSCNGSKKIRTCSMIFFTAGVAPSDVECDSEKKNEKGSLIVDEFLQITDAQNAWAAGDISFYVNPADGKPVPMLAQSAKSEGMHAAHNIAASISGKEQKKYEFRSKGFLLSVGRGFAVGNLFGKLISGRFIWWMKRTVYAMEFIGFGTRIKKIFSISFSSVFKKRNSQDK